MLALAAPGHAVASTLPPPATAAAVGAAPPAATVAGSAPALDFGSSVGQMLFGLVVVIALLFGCLWLIRRLSATRGSGAAIKLLGAAAVGPRERVVLVELGEQVLVLGVAPGSVTKLHEMPRDQLPTASNTAASDTTAPTAAPLGGKAFAGWLKQAMERRNAR
jgi:flagellar protein FliO/FliZ